MEGLQIKRGNGAAMPLLAAGELAFAVDSNTLYVGTGAANVPVNANVVTTDDEGNVKLTGNLILKGSGNYGNKINFGDSDYVHISEPADDTLELKGTRIKLCSGSTEALKVEGGKVYVNGVEVNSVGIGMDFDVLANTKGYSCVTAKTATGYTETITNTATAKKAALRTTTKQSNGYQEAVNFYKEDGTTVKETRTKTTTKTATGFSEVIV